MGFNHHILRALFVACLPDGPDGVFVSNDGTMPHLGRQAIFQQLVRSRSFTRIRRDPELSRILNTCRVKASEITREEVEEEISPAPGRVPIW
jgi:hypothetical protein